MTTPSHAMKKFTKDYHSAANIHSLALTQDDQDQVPKSGPFRKHDLLQKLGRTCSQLEPHNVCYCNSEVTDIQSLFLFHLYILISGKHPIKCSSLCQAMCTRKDPNNNQ